MNNDFLLVPREVRSLFSEPFSVLSVLGLSLGPVMLRMRNEGDSSGLLVMELCFYGGIIALASIQAGLQTIKERTLIDLQIERGVVLQSGLARVMVQSLFYICLCSFGIIYSAMVSKLGWAFWISLWFVAAGCSIGMATMTHILAVGIMNRLQKDLGVASILFIVVFAIGYGAFQFLGILMVSTLFDDSLERIVVFSCCAWLFSSLGLLLHYMVLRGFPRRTHAENKLEAHRGALSRKVIYVSCFVLVLHCASAFILVSGNPDISSIDAAEHTNDALLGRNIEASLPGITHRLPW